MCVAYLYRLHQLNIMPWPSLRSGDLGNRNANSIKYKMQQPVHIHVIRISADFLKENCLPA